MGALGACAQPKVAPLPTPPPESPSPSDEAHEAQEEYVPLPPYPRLKRVRQLGEYRFVSDQPFGLLVFPLSGELGRPEAGDVLYNEGRLLVLGPSTEIHLTEDTHKCPEIRVSLQPEAPVELIPDATCLTLRGGGSSDGKGPSGDEILRSLPSLEYLALDLTSLEVDLRLLTKLPKLRFLSLFTWWDEGVPDLSVLGELTSLEGLDLRVARKLDLSFISHLSKLRALVIADNQVETLAPLQDLPELRLLEADWTPLERLPQGAFPKLRRLSVLTPSLPPEEVERFQQEHPKTEIRASYKADLEKLLEQASRFVIDDLVLDRPEDVDGLRRLLLEVDETRAGWACRCYGAPHIDVFAGDVWLDTISMQHGQAIQTVGWPNGVVFTDGIPEKLAAWLKRRGVTRPAWDLERRNEFVTQQATIALGRAPRRDELEQFYPYPPLSELPNYDEESEPTLP